MGKLDQLYAVLPIWAQHAAVTLYGYHWHRLRFGGAYQYELDRYLERESYTAGDWKDWQNQQLKQSLKHCVESIPYYKNTWSKQQKEAALEGELSGLPLLEKDPLRQNPTQFVREDIHPKHKVFHTSGSTGTPIACPYTLEELQRSVALREARSCRWAKVSYSMPRATFSGRMVEPNPNRLGPRYRFNAVEKQVYFSPFHLSPQTAHFYVEALRKHRTKWLTGYAVSYSLLAQYILKEKLDCPKLDAVITTSEKCWPEMKEKMEEAYQCRVYEEYSTVENALFASECEQGRLHLSPDVAEVEILRPDGKPCLPGELGEVVVTRLSHEYQILTRFRLGDRACFSDQPCSCGRQMPILEEVAGRIEDVVKGPDGREMVRFHGVWVGLPRVLEGQVIQKTIDHITLRVVVDQGYGAQEEGTMRDRIQERLGHSVRVDFEIVDQLPREKSGKVKAVISELK